MKVILEATGTIERVNGSPARMWVGKTESGIEVTAWIPVIRVSADADTAEFERELREVKATRELVSFDMRVVL